MYTVSQRGIESKEVVTVMSMTIMYTSELIIFRIYCLCFLVQRLTVIDSE